MIEFKCSQCGKQLKVKDNAAGKKGKCPQCGATLLVPQPEMVTLEAAEPSRSTPPPSPYANARSTDEGTQPPQLTKPRNQKHRRWVALLIVGAIVAAPFAPKFPLWFGILLLALCVVAFMPGVQGFSRRLLRLNPREKWRSGLRLTMYGLIGLVLIIAGRTGAEYKAEQGRIAAKQTTQKAEQRRLANEANAQVVALVSEAESAWQQGDSALVKVKLEEAEKTSHATNLTPIRQLRARMANAEVESLMAEATSAVKAGDIDTAKDKVQAALAVPHADALAEAKKLDEQIGNATDPNRIRATLMGLPEEAFRQLQEGGEMPTQLVSGYEGLDSRTTDLARAQLADVAAAREQLRRERLERERVAAEAAQKAEEERKAREAAAAEAKRKEKRKKRIESGFSAWDGSHRGLTKVIKAAMNDPKSYEHVKTVYWDRGNHLVVRTTFRGKNAFGGVVPNWIKAKVDLDGNVLAIIEQGP